MELAICPPFVCEDERQNGCGLISFDLKEEEIKNKSLVSKKKGVERRVDGRCRPNFFRAIFLASLGC